MMSFIHTHKFIQTNIRVFNLVNLDGSINDRMKTCKDYTKVPAHLNTQTTTQVMI